MTSKEALKELVNQIIVVNEDEANIIARVSNIVYRDLEELEILKILKPFFKLEQMNKGGVLSFKSKYTNELVYGQVLIEDEYYKIKEWLKNDK